MVVEDRRAGLAVLEDLRDDTPLFDLRLAEDRRGQSLGAPVLRALTWETLRRYPHVRRFEGVTRWDNVAMRRTFRRAGWVKEAHYRSAWPVPGGSRSTPSDTRSCAATWSRGRRLPCPGTRSPDTDRRGRKRTHRARELRYTVLSAGQRRELVDLTDRVPESCSMQITVEPLRLEDAEAIVAAEDEETIRWLTGGRSSVEGTREYVRDLDRRAENGSTKRAFCIWVDGECVGSIDYDADPQDGIGPGDVNISYAIAPWMRRRGVTSRAVDLLLDIIRERDVAKRAVIRCDPDNESSVRVAEKAGFAFAEEIRSSTDADAEGNAPLLWVLVRELATENADGVQRA